MTTFTKWMEGFNFQAIKHPDIQTPEIPRKKESPDNIQAWQVWKATERMICPQLEQLGLNAMPIETKVVAVDAILKFLGVKINDLQQYSNQ